MFLSRKFVLCCCISLILFLLRRVLDGQRGFVGVLQDHGNQAVRSVEVSNLMVILQIGQLGLCVQLFLQSVTDLLP